MQQIVRARRPLLGKELCKQARVEECFSVNIKEKLSLQVRSLTFGA